MPKSSGFLGNSGSSAAAAAVSEPESLVVSVGQLGSSSRVVRIVCTTV